MTTNKNNLLVFCFQCELRKEKPYRRRFTQQSCFFFVDFLIGLASPPPPLPSDASHFISSDCINQLIIYPEYYLLWMLLFYNVNGSFRYILCVH